MTLPDLNTIREFTLQQYKQNASNQKLDGMKRDLNESEMLIIAYYEGVVRYLIKHGKLSDDKSLDVGFLVSDSKPQEDDYEY